MSSLPRGWGKQSGDTSTTDSIGTATWGRGKEVQREGGLWPLKRRSQCSSISPGRLPSPAAFALGLGVCMVSHV